MCPNHNSLDSPIDLDNSIRPKRTVLCDARQLSEVANHNAYLFTLWQYIFSVAENVDQMVHVLVDYSTACQYRQQQFADASIFPHLSLHGFNKVHTGV